MISIRRSKDRGHADHGWLDSRHTFSFADYYDPEQMGFRSLRVINDDRIAAGGGFPTHGHRDMEILSYVVEGALEHRDNLGNGDVLRPGDVQVMTAGRGVTHSEFNASKDEPVRLLQIWILPERSGLDPAYDQRHFPLSERSNRLRLVASRDAREGSLGLHQDVSIYASRLESGQGLQYAVTDGRHAWLQLVAGTLKVAGEILEEGDGLSLSGSGVLDLRAEREAEFLLFDLS